MQFARIIKLQRIAFYFAITFPLQAMRTTERVAMQISSLENIHNQRIFTSEIRKQTWLLKLVWSLNFLFSS